MSKKTILGWALFSLATLPLSAAWAKRRASVPAPEPEQQWPEQAPPENPATPEPPPEPIELPPFMPVPPLTLPELPPLFPGLPPIDPYPTTPEVPTEPPQERAKPKVYKFRALHRYEVTVDALPVPGVSLRKLAESVIPYMRMTDPDFSSTESVKRNGRDATRVRMQVSSLFDHEEPLERERSFAGVGSIWLVRAVDRGSY